MENENLLPSSKVRAAFGDISGMTLWRWVDKGILQKPIVINGRNYWPESAVSALKKGSAEKVTA